MEIIKKEVSQHELRLVADHIEAVAKAAQQFQTSRLKEKTILVLLKHMTGLPERDIKAVLNALPLLGKEYLKPAPLKPTK